MAEDIPKGFNPDVIDYLENEQVVKENLERRGWWKRLLAVLKKENLGKKAFEDNEYYLGLGRQPMAMDDMQRTKPEKVLGLWGRRKT